MANKMLIDAMHPEETRVVTVHGSRVEEFDFEAANRRQLRGNIYLAKVTRVEPSLQAAFVEYGGNRHGFLAFNEIHPDYYQIPLADRQALLEDEARDAEEHRDREERRRKSPRRSRGRRAEARTRTDETVSGEDAPSEVSAQLDADALPDALAENPEAVREGIASEEQAHDAEADHAEAHDAEADHAEADHAGADHAGKVEADHAAAAPAEAVSDEHAAPADAPHVETAAAAAPAVPHEAEVEPETAAAIAEALSVEVPETAPAEAESDDDDADDEDDDAEEDDEDEDDEESEDESDDPDAEPRIAQVGGNGDAMAEIPERPRHSRRHYKIQEVIKRRQIILVQVVKEERGTKGAALTTYLSLAGRYSVLMPNTAQVEAASRARLPIRQPTVSRLKDIVQASSTCRKAWA